MMKRQQSGFTLVEFLIIIVILCVILIVAVPRIDLWKETAWETKLKELEQSMRLVNSLVYAKACCDDVIIDGNPIATDSGYIDQVEDFAMLIDGVGMPGELDVSFWADNGNGMVHSVGAADPYGCGVKYIRPSDTVIPLGAPGYGQPIYEIKAGSC
jgi:type II secretory pathway pseudopilin PulG